MSNIRMRNKLRMSALAGVLVATIAGGALAASEDYRFEVVQPPVGSACGLIATVRLIHVASGQPVTDAEVFQRSSKVVFNISNKALPSTVVQTTPLRPDGHGNYQLIVGSPQKGGTSVTLLARVPAGSTTVRDLVALPSASC